MAVSAVPLRSQFRFLHRVEGCTGRTQRVGGRGAAPVVRLSKIEDYLADNLCVPMLSEVMHWVQEESGGLRARFPNWESWRKARLSGAWTGHARAGSGSGSLGRPPRAGSFLER
jgi:hypothetical protein